MFANFFTKITDNAYACDPRIKYYKEKEKEEKESKRKAKQDAARTEALKKEMVITNIVITLIAVKLGDKEKRRRGKNKTRD